MYEEVSKQVSSVYILGYKYLSLFIYLFIYVIKYAKAWQVLTFPFSNSQFLKR